MLNTELHSIHQPFPSMSTSTAIPTSLTPADMLKPPEHLDESTIQALMLEMEDILVENKLKSEVGPIRSAWDKAVATSLNEKRSRRGEEKGAVFSGAWGAPARAEPRRLVAARGRGHHRARSMSI
jgi:hypothetical protein